MTKTSTIPHPLWKVDFHFREKISGAMAQNIADALEDAGVSVFLHNRDATDGDDWTVSLTTLGKPDLDGIHHRIETLIDRRDISAERLPETDWLSQVHENFPPVVTGKFFIYGSHFKGVVPSGLTPLKIDAATAFGSGEHETTKGCLTAFEFLAESSCFENALDMGCGSGILAIAMTKLWPSCRVTAIDIDPESITVTNRHAGMNGTGLAAEAGDGYNTPLAAKNAPYGLIAANILADPLIAMASDLSRFLSKGGHCVLSGLLARQESDVVRAHEKQGLRLVKTVDIGAWRALILQKPL